MIVIARKYGQLGNRLFLFAHLIAAARHYGVELRNPCFAEYANLFPSTCRDLWCRYDAHLADRPQAAVAFESVASESVGLISEPLGNRAAYDEQLRRELVGVQSLRTRTTLMQSVQAVAKSMHVIGLRHYPAKVIRLKADEQCDLEGDRFRCAIDSGRTLMLQGWLFRSRRLLDKHWADIRDYFAVSLTDQAAIDSTIGQARVDCDVLVGVHIRRGDYANFAGGRYLFDDDDYSRWMHGVCEQLPGRRVRFLVCSHEKLDERKFAGLSMTRGPGSALQDMYALAETDWMMGPPSTFTAWAEYVGRKPRVELQSKTGAAIVPVMNGPTAGSQPAGSQPAGSQPARQAFDRRQPGTKPIGRDASRMMTTTPNAES